MVLTTEGVLRNLALTASALWSVFVSGPKKRKKMTVIRAILQPMTTASLIPSRSEERSEFFTAIEDKFPKVSKRN